MYLLLATLYGKKYLFVTLGTVLQSEHKGGLAQVLMVVARRPWPRALSLLRWCRHKMAAHARPFALVSRRPMASALPYAVCLRLHTSIRRAALGV